MENNVKEKKLGAGIITMSIIFIVMNAFAIFGLVIAITNLEEVNNYAVSLGGEKSTMGPLIFSVAIAVLMLLSLALILFKKGIGVYLFVGLQIVSRVYSIITSGVQLGTLIGLILPALFLYFIYKKKDIYFNK